MAVGLKSRSNVTKRTMVSMGTIKNILAYIEGSGRVALENKHLKVKELPALQQNIFTPKGYVDWDFVWKNDRVIIVSRAKEAGIETPPEKATTIFV